jgi:2'-deoxynucleoside 5'-phosphate N-hydrolase
MIKFFCSYSYSKRHEYEDFHEKLKKYLLDNIADKMYAFVYDFKEDVDDQTLMETALSIIKKSDYLIVEPSNKSIGVGIEAGYAKANNIPIIYLIKEGEDVSQTMNGISSFKVNYNTVDDVISWFEDNKSKFIKPSNCL